MLTVGNALVKALAKYQKVTFWSKKKWLYIYFFWLSARDALSNGLAFF